MNQKAELRYLQLRHCLERLEKVEQKILEALDAIALDHEFDEPVGETYHNSALTRLEDVRRGLVKYRDDFDAEKNRRHLRANRPDVTL